jgi:adenylate cyclase
VLRIRIGMARGDVIESDDTYVGQTVVRAVRICAAAGPGQVLVGEDVIETVSSDSAEFEFMNTVPLKGFGISVPLYRAVA